MYNTNNIDEDFDIMSWKIHNAEYMNKWKNDSLKSYSSQIKHL